MANWEKFRENVGRTVNKAAVKAGEIGDSVKLRYKLHRAKGELTALYEKLGRITYDQLHYSHDHAEEVSGLIAQITRQQEKVRRLSAAAAKEENAVYCANCGTRLEENMYFCPGCGQKQEAAKSEE